MSYGKEILTQKIKTYFLVVYNHQLIDEEAISISTIFCSQGITSDLISFALGDKGGPQPNPDDNFDPEKIFGLWYVLHPITVRLKENHLLQVFCKGILCPYLLDINANNAMVLSKVFQRKSRANLEATQFFYSSFLGHSEFEMARSYNERNPELADRYYRRCIEHLMAARKLSLKEDPYNYGMVGVSHYYVAQFLSGVEKQRHLSVSIENLESAERLGDKTTDHFKFL